MKGRDRELVLSLTLISGFLTLIGYLVADLCYAWRTEGELRMTNMATATARTATMDRTSLCLIGYLVADPCYAVADPRVSYE